jgi:hypothetical protein
VPEMDRWQMYGPSIPICQSLPLILVLAFQRRASGYG